MLFILNSIYCSLYRTLFTIAFTIQYTISNSTLLFTAIFNSIWLPSRSDLIIYLLQDLFWAGEANNSSGGVRRGVKILLSTHHIYHYVVSDVASYIHLAVLIANL